MRVSQCERCEYCKRYVWSHTYKPANYHAIGMTHAYHKCDLAKERIINVRHCPKETPDDDTQD